MVLRIMVPHFPAIGCEGLPSVPPTILMSAMEVIFRILNLGLDQSPAEVCLICIGSNITRVGLHM